MTVYILLERCFEARDVVGVYLHEADAQSEKAARESAPDSRFTVYLSIEAHTVIE